MDRIGFWLLFLAATPALAGGRYNLPTNPWQFVGWGFGPGYHAPMVLGSTCDNRSAAQGVERTLPAPVSPYYVPQEEHLPGPGVDHDAWRKGPYAVRPLEPRPPLKWRPAYQPPEEDAAAESIFAPPAPAGEVLPAPQPQSPSDGPRAGWLDPRFGPRR